MAAVGRKEVALLGAHADVVYGLHSGVLELRTVGGGKVQEQAVAGALADESPIELRRDLGSDLVAAAADSRTDAGPDVSAAVLAFHEQHRGRGHSGTGSTPARMDKAPDPFFRIP